jgi:hypothetical protein
VRSRLCPDCSCGTRIGVMPCSSAKVTTCWKTPGSVYSVQHDLGDVALLGPPRKLSTISGERTDRRSAVRHTDRITFQWAGTARVSPSLSPSVMSASDVMCAQVFRLHRSHVGSQGPTGPQARDEPMLAPRIIASVRWRTPRPHESSIQRALSRPSRGMSPQGVARSSRSVLHRGRRVPRTQRRLPVRWSIWHR